MLDGSSCCDRFNWLEPETIVVSLTSVVDVPSIDWTQTEIVSRTDESVSLIVDDLLDDPVVDKAREDWEDGPVDVEPVLHE